MKIPNISTITDAGQAEQLAIDWQHWFSEEDHYMSELADWGDFFTELGTKFNLTDEFRENGII